MKGEEKLKLKNRLRRIEGQIAGVSRMIEEDRYCVDTMNQTSAIIAALRNVENIILKNHLETCVADAMRSGDREEQERKTSEVMQIIGKYRK